MNELVRMQRTIPASVGLFFMVIASPLVSAQSESLPATMRDENSIEQRFDQDHRSLVQKYCWSCHSAQQAEASLDLKADNSVESIIRHHATWQIVIQRVKAGEMPPADAPEQPTPEERSRLISWLEALLQREADRNSEDPGVVLIRRLSNAEFDNSIRDITGVDIRPTRSFPVDPANEAGFDNSGESLTMSPALLSKYVDAARGVADHLVLTPRGFQFAAFPCVVDTDRDKFCVQRIVDFYRQHDVKYELYFQTLWRYSRLEKDKQTSEQLESLAKENGLSHRYLALLHETLHSEQTAGPLAEVQAFWKQSIDSVDENDEAELACQKLSLLVKEIREDLTDTIPIIKIEGISTGSQPLVEWKNRQQAEGRRSFPGDGKDAQLDAARDGFCKVFPDTFCVSSRGHYSNAELGANLRLLSAGFHLMQGYCRDDLPLRELVLTPDELVELDQLWEDLEYVTQAPVRQYKDFLFFERAEPPQLAADPEFDFARPENRDVTTVASLQRMRKAYLAKVAELGASDEANRAIEAYFDLMERRIRWIENVQSDAEESHLQALRRLAEKAWRSPLTESDVHDLESFYLQLRNQEQLSHEDAMRDSVASVLLSPRFCFRTDGAGSFEQVIVKAAVDDGPTPLTVPPSSRAMTDVELASRLSYFLWASLPDEELMSVATRGELTRPEVLHAQVERMLNDPKVSGLATEFLANWLDFRRFEEHNAVDRTRFPSFDDELRSAMFEEPLRYFVDLVQRDGAIDELISAPHTFVNATLAKHYGVPSKSDTSQTTSSESNDRWHRVEEAASFGRGGLLPMSVFMTRNSPGLRTSPVKRGYWVVRRLLGEHIPAPPPNVPELPADESDLGELTLSQMLAKHRENVACAGCHDRFDAVGLIFESYGPIGELRREDLSGNPIQAQAVFPNGSKGETLADLQHYLLNDRRDDFHRNFVRKLLAYALGRSLQLSDAKLIESLQTRMAQENGRVRSAIHGIVTSPQFLRKRTGESSP